MDLSPHDEAHDHLAALEQLLAGMRLPPTREQALMGAVPATLGTVARLHLEVLGKLVDAHAGLGDRTPHDDCIEFELVDGGVPV